MYLLILQPDKDTHTQNTHRHAHECSTQVCHAAVVAAAAAAMRRSSATLYSQSLLLNTCTHSPHQPCLTYGISLTTMGHAGLGPTFDRPVNSGLSAIQRMLDHSPLTRPRLQNMTCPLTVYYKSVPHFKRILYSFTSQASTNQTVQ